MTTEQKVLLLTSLGCNIVLALLYFRLRLLYSIANDSLVMQKETNEKVEEDRKSTPVSIHEVRSSKASVVATHNSLFGTENSSMAEVCQMPRDEIQETLKFVDCETLAMALSNEGPEIRVPFYREMSERAADMVDDYAEEISHRIKD